MKLLLIGRRRPDLSWVSDQLWRNHGFVKKRMLDGTDKMARYFYSYATGHKIRWEKKVEFYDALYKMDPQIHLNLMLRRLALSTAEDIVIDDVRYMNELEALRKEGFLVIRINSPTTGRKVFRGLKNAASGTILLRENFSSNISKISADYSIYIEDKETAKDTLEKLLDTIRNESV